MAQEILVVDDGEGWPFVRRATLCVICQREKPIGKIVCDTCRTTKTFLSMTARLEAAEQSMRWIAAREPDRPASPRVSDPTLAPCEKCGSTSATFMTFQVPGKIVAGRVTPRTHYYVLCHFCRCQTLPYAGKKQAATIWMKGGKGVFVAS